MLDARGALNPEKGDNQMTLSAPQEKKLEDDGTMSIQSSPQLKIVRAKISSTENIPTTGSPTAT